MRHWFMTARPSNGLEKVIHDALGGGIPGMTAMVAQVSTLMWLRTVMNYQYTHGSTMTNAMKVLYRQGGVSRFYKGYGFAILQGPLSRFGDTASNMGVLSLLAHTDLPIAVKTSVASLVAALFRILLMPLDTYKTMLQVEGNKGWSIISQKVRSHGPSVLFHGSIASATATMAGHYPWYTTYNYLSTIIPEYQESITAKLTRSAGIGFCASVVSDTISNSFRVIKTARQASKDSVTYSQIVATILRKDGVYGLLGRGLKTRLLTNVLQGTMFSVCWKLGQDYWSKTEKNQDSKKEL